MANTASGTKRVFKNEAKELLHTGNVYVMAVVLVLLVFLYFTVIMPTIIDTFDLDRSTEITAEYREKQLSYYQSRIDVLEERKAGGSGQLAYLESDRLAHEKYIFLIETNTIEEDYFSADNLYANYRSNRDAVNMVFTADSSAVILMLLAVLLAFLLFFMGLKGTRNIYEAAGFSRRDVVMGKFILSQIILNATAVILFVVGLLSGIGTGATALIYAGGWTGVSPVAIYIARMIGAYILMQLMFVGALFAHEFMKSKLFGVLAPVIIYLFVLSLMIMIIGVPFAGETVLAFIPFIGLQYAVVVPWSVSFIISAVLHIAAAAGLGWLLFWLIRRRTPAVSYIQVQEDKAAYENDH